MTNELLLLAGQDLPFEQAQLIIHPPTIKQIAFIGEKTFYSGCQYLNFSKKNLQEKDKNRLDDLTDFEVLMTIMRDKNIAVQQGKISMQLVLLLMFPDYNISFLPMSILKKKKTDEGMERHTIDKENFESFRNIVSKMFCLDYTQSDSSKYNPGGPQAEALVKKFKQRQKRLAKLKSNGKQSDISILLQYVSILAVGLHKNINELMQYTVYQLFDEFRRFRLKEQNDLYLQLKIAGAKNLDDVKNWMSDIHSDI